MSAWLSIQMCLEFAFVGSMETSEFSCFNPFFFFFLKAKTELKSGSCDWGLWWVIRVRLGAFWGSDN